MSNTAVYIGRFQPIHNAHIKTIDKALSENNELVIAVGSSHAVQTIKNPWTFEQRKEFIQEAIEYHFQDANVLNQVYIVPVRDYLYNDYQWLSELRTRIYKSVGRSNNITLYGHKKDSSSYYLDMFPTWDFEPMRYLYNLDATDIRSKLFEQGYIESSEECVPKSVEQWINEWTRSDNDRVNHLFDEYKHYSSYKDQWSDAPYVPIFHTTDGVIIKSGCVLMIKRKIHPGKGLYALPGGFLDADEFIEDSCVREIYEETSIRLHEDDLRSSIAKHKTFDHPDRSLRGRTITEAYLFDLGTGYLPDVEGGNDAEHAEWVPISDLHHMTDQIFEDHYHIINNLISKFH